MMGESRSMICCLASPSVLGTEPLTLAAQPEIMSDSGFRRILRCQHCSAPTAKRSFFFFGSSSGGGGVFQLTFDSYFPLVFS